MTYWMAMKADSGIDLAALKVDGGASANNFLMQTQADIIQCTGQTVRPVWRQLQWGRLIWQVWQ